MSGRRQCTTIGFRFGTADMPIDTPAARLKIVS
jgi:hypothetical protein